MTTIKTLTAAVTIAICAQASATSYKSSGNDTQTATMASLSPGAEYDYSTVDTNYTDGVLLHDYVEPSKVIETGVLFFYTRELLEFYGGDLTQIYAFARVSIESNNNAFKNGGIGLRRTIAGILPMPEGFDNAQMAELGGPTYLKEFLSGESDPTQRSPALDKKYGTYKASYYVALARSYPDIPWVGKASLGGQTAIVTPFDDVRLSVTVLSHELGHNDGGIHYSGEQEFNYGYQMYPFSAGAQCGEDNATSLMSLHFDGSRRNFFSDIAHQDSDTGEACGESDESEMGRVYRNAIAEDDYPWFSKKNGIMMNYRLVNPSKGTATLDMDSVEFDETSGAITGMVIWEGLDSGDNASIEVAVSDYGDTTPDDFVGAPAVNLMYTGEPMTSFEIELADDADYEPDETATFALASPNGISVNEGAAEAIVTIKSDEAGQSGTVTFSDASVSGNEGETLTLTLVRENGAEGELAFGLDIEEGTASTSDITLPAEVIFANGELNKSIEVLLRADSVDENEETLTITLVGKPDSLGATASVDITINADSTTTSESPSTSPDSSGGGGSIGAGLLAFAVLAILRRRAYLCR